MVLGIYGAGGLGRELLILAQQVNKIQNRWDDLIFIDDTDGLTEVKGIQTMPFEKTKMRYMNENLVIVIAVGEPRNRRLLRERIQDAGFSLTTIIHPSVIHDNGSSIGAGTVICCNCFVSCDVKIGENVLIQTFACIAHDGEIGNDTVISTFAGISGRCIIGNETYIGLHAAIKENVTVGSQTIVGMGAVVIGDIPNKVVAVGNPARILKDNIDRKVFQIRK